MCFERRLLFSEQVSFIENSRQSRAFFAVILVAETGLLSVVLVKRTV